MPFTLLAAANAAVAAIQQGCELYKEYKGTVLQAKATFDEVKGIAVELEDVGTGIWEFIKSKLFNKEKPPTPILPDIKKSDDSGAPLGVTSKRLDWDEQAVKADLVKNLKVFFKTFIALQKKKKTQDDRIETEDIDPDELLDISLDQVVVLKEMEKLQKTIRETMVYQSPPELGALYTDVVNMFGLVQEKQEITRLANLRKRKNEWLRKERILSKLRQRVAWVVGLAIIVLEIWGLIISIILARQHS
jgi:hypothetical protein